MRKIDEATLEAFKYGYSMQQGNTMVITDDEGETRVILHCHIIAIFSRKYRTLQLMNCGYVTNVTRARLNAVLKAINPDNKVHIEDFEMYAYWYDSNCVLWKKPIVLINEFLT